MVSRSFSKSMYVAGSLLIATVLPVAAESLGHMLWDYLRGYDVQAAEEDEKEHPEQQDEAQARLPKIQTVQSVQQIGAHTGVSSEISPLASHRPESPSPVVMYDPKDTTGVVPYLEHPPKLPYFALLSIAMDEVHGVMKEANSEDAAETCVPYIARKIQAEIKAGWRLPNGELGPVPHPYACLPPLWDKDYHDRERAYGARNRGLFAWLT